MRSSLKENGDEIRNWVTDEKLRGDYWKESNGNEFDFSQKKLICSKNENRSGIASFLFFFLKSIKGKGKW